MSASVSTKIFTSNRWRRALVGEHQDALDQDDWSRLDRRAFRCAIVVLKVVGGAEDRLAAHQRIDVPGQQIELESVGMVVVDLLALLERQMTLLAVVVVLLEQGDLASGESGEDGPGDRALTRPRAAGDSHHERSDRLGRRRHGVVSYPGAVAARPPGSVSLVPSVLQLTAGLPSPPPIELQARTRTMASSGWPSASSSVRARIRPCCASSRVKENCQRSAQGRSGRGAARSRREQLVPLEHVRFARQGQRRRDRSGARDHPARATASRRRWRSRARSPRRWPDLAARWPSGGRSPSRPASC